MQNSLFLLDPKSKTLTQLHQTSMVAEDFQEPRDLESWLASVKGGSSLFGRKVLWISRQDRTEDDHRSDLIGVADNGDLLVAELKRGQLVETAIMQALSYAADYSTKSAEDLASIFLSHSTKESEKTSLIGRASSPEDATSQIAGLVSQASDEPVEINSAQTILLVAEDFTASALKACDYLNQALKLGGQLIIECWRYRLYKEPTEKYLFSMEKVLPRIELEQEIETSREKARASKYLRDRLRMEFIRELKEYLNNLEGVEATRNKGQSYEIEARFADWPEESGLSVYAQKDGPVCLIPWGHCPIPSTIPLSLRHGVHSDGRSMMELVDTNAKTLAFSNETAELIVDAMKLLTPDGLGHEHVSSGT